MNCMLMITIPHSGEEIPSFVQWLNALPEPVVMCDVDRYVDQIYEPSIVKLAIPFVKTQWHRYIGDLNRFDSDVDCDSVMGNSNPSGKFKRGFIWVQTTTNQILLPQPVSVEVHKKLVELIYNPFHKSVQEVSDKIMKDFKKVYHLDLHSMPSKGTKEHRDPGESRADVVVSDNFGKSSEKKFVDLVIESYKKQGFSVAHNWPYYGGRVTERYGLPEKNHHTVQVELNRKLYMDEGSKAKNNLFTETSGRAGIALEMIQSKILEL